MGEEMNSHVERQKPKPYHHGDLRYALIQAGLELLSEGGAAALDLRKVARKAGVSHAAPYRHFADKQALIAAINEEVSLTAIQAHWPASCGLFCTGLPCSPLKTRCAHTPMGQMEQSV